MELKAEVVNRWQLWRPADITQHHGLIDRFRAICAVAGVAQSLVILFVSSRNIVSLKHNIVQI